MKENIVLCGFMGCGKTTVGKLLNKLTNKDFIDVDDYIEKKEALSVTDIFTQKGEQYFRNLETNACKELSQKSDIIICPGGGALTFAKNAKLLRTNSIIFFLDVTPETIEKRLKNDTTRPILQTPNKGEVIRKLLLQRLPLYKANSDIIVNGNRSPLNVAKNIVEEFNNYNKAVFKH